MSREIYEDDEGCGCLTPAGFELVRRIRELIDPIISDCVEDGVDLHHASHVAQSEVHCAFLDAIIKKRLTVPKREKVERSQPNLDL